MQTISRRRGYLTKRFKTMNIYLDIDGVLLTKKGEPVFYIEKFLKIITDNCVVHWLTTHCRGGENGTVDYLRDKLPASLYLSLWAQLPVHSFSIPTHPEHALRRLPAPNE